MKSLVYVVIIGVCAWIIIEPKDPYQSDDLPQVQLYERQSVPITNPEIDTLISNIEKNIEYLNNANLTSN